MGAIIILLMVAIFVIIFAAAGFKIVQQAETMIIERLGKYNRTLESGINIIWPLIDQPRSIMWRFSIANEQGEKINIVKHSNKIDLRETVYDFPKQNVITKDNVTVEINALIYFQVMDSVKAVYEIENLPDAIEKLTQTTLRNVIGGLELDQSLTSRDTINIKLREILDDATNKWGVKVNRVELQDINPPQAVKIAMEKQMRAERDRRATVLEAEGIKDAAILRATGEKEAEILKAEGEAIARLKVAEAEAKAITCITQAVENKQSDPLKYLIAVKYIDTLSDMVSGQNNKTVYMPFEATGVLSSLGGIKELLGGK